MKTNEIVYVESTDPFSPFVEQSGHGARARSGPEQSACHKPSYSLRAYRPPAKQQIWTLVALYILSSEYPNFRKRFFSTRYVNVNNVNVITLKFTL